MTKKKTTKNKIDLTVVIDRSGSMAEMREEAENGLNSFFDNQREVAPNTRVTLVQFDTEYEFIHKDVPISKVGKYSLVPRGMTALLDAIGKAAAAAEERFAKLTKSTKRVFVVLTDGYENASQEWTKEKIKITLENLKTQACEIVFLGANIDSFAEAHSMGITLDNVSNYSGSPKGMRTAMASLGENVTSFSIGASPGLAYSDVQRKAMTGDEDPIISRKQLDTVRLEEKLSWAGLERAVGVGNATLKNYSQGKTAKLSQTTEERLKEHFPNRFTG